MDLKIKLSTVGFKKSQKDRGLGVFPQPSSGKGKKGWVPPTSTHHRPQADKPRSTAHKSDHKVLVSREKKRVGPAHMLFSVLRHFVH